MSMLQAARRTLTFVTVPVLTVAILAAVPGPVLHGQQPAAAPGGLMDSATSVGLRPALSAGQIAAFMPARGPFTFPSPYSTTGIRLSNAADCGGGDCVQPVGYSYWSNINNHTGRDTMLIFLGLERRRGGGGPTLFSYNKRTGETVNRGALFGPDSPFSWATGEGWYFSATRATTLYMNDGPRILRYDVEARTFETVFDAAPQFGTDKYLWQLHSSNDDRVHSATLRDSGSYEMLGCVVYDERARRATYFARKGDFDECQIDRSGRWLVIKDNVDGLNGEDNRVIDLQTGNEQLLTDPNGASGHSDVGFGVLIAEDNFNRLPGAVRRWNFAIDMHGGQPAPVAGQGDLVYQLSSWASGIGHIAFGNARADLAIEQQRACASNASREALPRVNEIVCFRLDGSLETLVVAPNLVDLNAAGGGPDDYAKLPKGNIDVTGEYFIWTANAGTNRLDAFLVRIPAGRGGPAASAPAPAPPPASTPVPSPTPAPVPASGTAVEWVERVNAAATGGTLTKTGGCSGCPDAGAVSSQRIASGNARVSFVAAETQTLRYIGLSSGNTGTTPEEIRFGLRLEDGRAEVRERGVYRGETAVAAGDLLTVAVEAGVVSYARNGAVFYRSAAPPVYPMLVDTSLLEPGASVSSATIALH
jgi:hypothetical protein